MHHQPTKHNLSSPDAVISTMCYSPFKKKKIDKNPSVSKNKSLIPQKQNLQAPQRSK